MTTEATLQIYDYFPQVPPESRVDIEVETTTQFEDAQIDGFVIENLVFLIRLMILFSSTMKAQRVMVRPQLLILLRVK